MTKFGTQIDSIVLEIGAMNVMRSTNNNSACSIDGKNFYSLRIAYVRNLREDKTHSQATTNQQIENLHSIQK